MLFRMPDGEIAEVRRESYSTEEEYTMALFDVYGVRYPAQSTGHCDSDQTEFIYGLMMRCGQSRL